MDTWPDEKIEATALRYINQHVMNPSGWKSTVLGQVHPALQQVAALDEGERPIVAYFGSISSWYVLTTRRVLGARRERAVTIEPLDIAMSHFGNFKGYGTTTETMTLEANDGRTVELEFETGRASMAPIYYFRYWKIKFPVLHRLRA